ncbi:hypothetical protein TrRE_jg4484, partial [Triparma retinervis]
GVGIVGYLVAYPGEPFDYQLIDGGRGEGSSPPSGEKDDRGKGAGSPVKKSAADVARKEANLLASEVNPPAPPGQQLSLDMPTDKIMSKTSKVQKLFGLTDAQMRQAVENAKSESRGQAIDLNRVGASGDDGMSLNQKVDIFVYAMLFGALAYFSTRDGGKSVKRMMMTYFPKEARAMGIFKDEGEVQWRMN